MMERHTMQKMISWAINHHSWFCLDVSLFREAFRSRAVGTYNGQSLIAADELYMYGVHGVVYPVAGSIFLLFSC